MITYKNENIGNTFTALVETAFGGNHIEMPGYMQNLLQGMGTVSVN